MVGKQEVIFTWLLKGKTPFPVRFGTRIAGRDARARISSKDAESEEAQEHANSSSLALYA
jgi:hypothetical protein